MRVNAPRHVGAAPAPAAEHMCDDDRDWLAAALRAAHLNARMAYHARMTCRRNEISSISYASFALLWAKEAGDRVEDILATPGEPRAWDP